MLKRKSFAYENLVTVQVRLCDYTRPSAAAVNKRCGVEDNTMCQGFEGFKAAVDFLQSYNIFARKPWKPTSVA